jgi:hypothetical protein
MTQLICRVVIDCDGDDFCRCRSCKPSLAGSLCAEELWVPVSDLGCLYEVSSLGGFRSLRTGMPVRSRTNPDGYPIITISIEGRRYTRKLHRLVASAFLGSGSVLHNEVAHLDGDRANPRADNLKWVSRVENCSHKGWHGTAQIGEQHPRARLTEAAVAEIRSYPKYKINVDALAAKFGVTRYAIDDVRRGKNWRSVSFDQAQGRGL